MDDKRSLLREYYKKSDDASPNISPCNPYDFETPEFNPDLYLNKLLKESNLQQLIEKEQHLYKQIQSLDSDMQTLVYENYNKFISATETIRKMSTNFDKMEDELKLLSTNMEEITKSSEQISSNLRVRHHDLTKLSNTHNLITKLQFLFELSPQMKLSIEEKSYNEAVKLYLKAEKTLNQYCHFPSIAAIDEECKEILNKLKINLHEQFASKEGTQKQLSESIELLLQLDEAPEDLSQKFLAFSREKLSTHLNELDYQIDLMKKSSTEENEYSTLSMDILEFIDHGCNGFLANLSQVLATYEEIFVKKLISLNKQSNEIVITQNLVDFTSKLMSEFYDRIRLRISLENQPLTELVFFVRALDRFYRRLQSVSKIHPTIDSCNQSLEIVEEATKQQCGFILGSLQKAFEEELMSARHLVVSSNSSHLSASLAYIEKQQNLSELLMNLETSLSEQLKNSISSLLIFTQPDITFALRTKFKDNFCREYTREGVAVKYLQFILDIMLSYQKKASTSPPHLILLLSRLCLDFENSIISHLLNYVDEQLNINDKHGLTSVVELCQYSKESAQKLINFYVRLEGQNISQMIRKSVETRDWLSSVEPRSVRSVMKRVVEDIAVIDSSVGQLYEEGIRPDKSSDSSRSRRTFSATGMFNKSQAKSNWSSYGGRSVEPSLLSNIQKLFSERIEIFSSVEFSKLSVVTGIIKISLKTFLECIRLCTFSKFSLQQVQVDAYFLQTHLWRFVSDEHLVHNLLDEVLQSTVHRCLDPVFMEMSIVEKICEGT